jgi:hypothetical protein
MIMSLQDGDLLIQDKENIPIVESNEENIPIVEPNKATDPIGGRRIGGNPVCETTLSPKKCSLFLQYLVKKAALEMMSITFHKIPDSTSPGGLRNHLPIPASVDVSGIQSDGSWTANWAETARHSANQAFINEIVRRILAEQVKYLRLR